MSKPKLNFYIQDSYLPELRNLPRHLDLEIWEKRGIKFVEFRKGISRHTVKFLKNRHFSFAIKQTTEYTAKKEIAKYEKLLSLGIHTLLTVGYVVYKKKPFSVQTKVETSYENDENAFVITILEEKALADSHLYKLNFKEKNLNIIWDAIAELLAVLHFNNIYWGDATISNMLIKFVKAKDEKGRVRTELKAILSDAETVRVLKKIPPEIRAQDLSDFFESMNWVNEDYKKAGYIRENFSTVRDKKYILQKYKQQYSKLKKIAQFEKETGINARQHFHNINDIYGLQSIKKQIDEHKWYLSEKDGKEINIKSAAEGWLNNIYNPIINEFEKLDIFECFPFKNSVELYVDIMTHKYYLSREAGKDAGIEITIKNYSKKYAEDSSFFTRIKNIFESLRELFY